MSGSATGEEEKGTPKVGSHSGCPKSCMKHTLIAELIWLAGGGGKHPRATTESVRQTTVLGYTSQTEELTLIPTSTRICVRCMAPCSYKRTNAISRKYRAACATNKFWQQLLWFFDPMFVCFNPAFGCQTSINLYTCIINVTTVQMLAAANVANYNNDKVHCSLE